MPPSRRSRASYVVLSAAAASLIAAGCHHAPAVVATAKPAANADSARLARAHADSLTRATTARRAAAARAKAAADSARVVAEQKQNAAARAKAILLAPVLFALDQAELRVPERTMLDRKAAILAANHDIRLRIVGNTDEQGSDEYNLALGMRRAAAAQQYLADHGIDTTRLELTSSGEEHPACTDHEEWCWAQNRRDEFVIVAGGDRIIAAR
jgi:peptidoglycan-associated lipoprotein